MNKQYKVGIIGAGKIVENNHLPVLKNLDEVSVEWIYDTNPDRCTLLKDMYGVETIIATDLDNAIKTIDICLVTIPYGARKPYLIIAAKHNKAVYVEKPFALTVNEHLEIISMFRPNKIAVGFQRRCYKIANQLKYIIDSNIFGSLKHIDFKHGYFSLKGGSGYLSNVKLAGGGVILESAIHGYDMILNFTTAIDINLIHINYIQKDGIDYDADVQSIVTTSSSTIPVNCQTSTLRNLTNGFTISFEHAIIKCKADPDANIQVYPVNSNAQPFILENVLNNFDVSADTVSLSFFLFWKKFIEVLNEGKENITSASNSLLTTKWMENIYAGIRN